jgi:hypothetical protein
VFEVTPEGETVWEYVDPVGTPRAYRYACDHCSQTPVWRALKEVSVTPPQVFTIELDK